MKNDLDMAYVQIQNFIVIHDTDLL